MNQVKIPRNMLPNTVTVQARVGLIDLARAIRHARQSGNYGITNSGILRIALGKYVESLDEPITIDEAIGILQSTACKMGLSAKVALEQEARQHEASSEPNGELDSRIEKTLASLAGR